MVLVRQTILVGGSIAVVVDIVGYSILALHGWQDFISARGPSELIALSHAVMKTGTAGAETQGLRRSGVAGLIDWWMALAVIAGIRIAATALGIAGSAAVVDLSVAVVVQPVGADFLQFRRWSAGSATIEQPFVHLAVAIVVLLVT